MRSKTVHSNCLDASALVKLYVKEAGSDDLHNYLRGQATWYTTQFCFFEALTVLKTKYKRQNRPDKMSEDEYHNAGYALVADFEAHTERVRDINFTDVHVFNEVQSLCRKYASLDFSDAFQILSVKIGYFSKLCGDSSTVLVTADKGLDEAAKQEGIRTYLIGSRA